MTNRYRIGLDVGTASVGVAAVSLSASNEPLDLIWHHVRVFDEPLEKGTGGLKSKQAARRLARMQRRQTDRRASRMRRIGALAPLLGLTGSGVHAADSGRRLPAIRARAARERIELDELLQVMLRLTKRRGYAGEFRPRKETARLGEVEGGSKDLQQQMAALAATLGHPAITLGEFLHHRWQQGLPTRLKVREVDDKTTTADTSSSLPNLYALRSQVEAEFEQIWQTQSVFHPVLNTTHNGTPLREVFHQAVFYQRPLKSVSGMVGQCSLEPTHARAPRAQPAFQRFRIEKTLADLRWGAGKRAEQLSSRQKAVIRDLLEQKDVVSFTAVYAALEQAGLSRPAGKGLNLDRLSRDELPGNRTRQAFRKLGLGEAWAALNEGTRVQVINFLADLGSPEQLDDPEWHTRFTKKDNTPRFAGPNASRYAPFIDFINRLRQSDGFERLAKMGFEGGRASYSVKALNRLTEWLKEPWWPQDWAGDMRPDEDQAIRVCYPEANNAPRQQCQTLPAPKATGNAVVDGSLRQIHFVINRMIRELGNPPQEIVVEMARDLSLGITRRNERERDIHASQKARREAAEAIVSHGGRVTPSRIRRYQLWRDQGSTFCPYCTGPISLADALNGAETEYEHILPRSLTQVGLKRSEIVLAHRHCNQQKGNRTPFEAWGDGRDSERWTVVEQRAAWLSSKGQHRKARLLLLQDFEKEVMNDESIAGFADRQFHQTSWIAKEAAQWLQAICPTPVSVSRGQLTAMLRRSWRLDTVIPEVRITEGLPLLDVDGNGVTPEEFQQYRQLWEGHAGAGNGHYTDRRLDKRLDHRHHLIDAITIALTSRGLFQRMAREYKLESERLSAGEHPRLKAVEPPIRQIREQALRAVTECALSIRPDRYPGGAFFQDTAYGVALRPGNSRQELTRRRLLSALVDPKKGTLSQARKAIASIVSDTIRACVSTAFESRIASGASPAQALAMPIFQNLYGRPLPVRKVTCFTGKYADGAITVVHTDKDQRSHHKHLVSDGFAYLEAEIKDGKVVRQKLVTTHEAMQGTRKPPGPGIIRLHKGDTVRDSKDNKTYRVGYFTSEGNIFLIPIVDPRAFDDIRESGSGKKKVSFGQVARLKPRDHTCQHTGF